LFYIVLEVARVAHHHSTDIIVVSSDWQYKTVKPTINRFMMIAHQISVNKYGTVCLFVNNYFTLKYLLFLDEVHPLTFTPTL